MLVQPSPGRDGRSGECQKKGPVEAGPEHSPGGRGWRKETEPGELLRPVSGDGVLRRAGATRSWCTVSSQGRPYHDALNFRQPHRRARPGCDESKKCGSKAHESGPQWRQPPASPSQVAPWGQSGWWRSSGSQWRRAWGSCGGVRVSRRPSCPCASSSQGRLGSQDRRRDPAGGVGLRRRLPSRRLLNAGADQRRTTRS